MMSVRQTIFLLFALQALVSVLSAQPSAAMPLGPQPAEACGISGRCNSAPPPGYIEILQLGAD